MYKCVNPYFMMPLSQEEVSMTYPKEAKVFVHVVQAGPAR